MIEKAFYLISLLLPLGSLIHPVRGIFLKLASDQVLPLPEIQYLHSACRMESEVFSMASNSYGMTLCIPPRPVSLPAVPHLMLCIADL